MGRLAYLELEDILDTVEFLLESTEILGLVIRVEFAGWCCIIRKDVWIVSEAGGGKPWDRGSCNAGSVGTQWLHGR